MTPDAAPVPGPTRDDLGSAQESRWLMRLGAGGAILGGLLAGVGNVLHPVTPRDDRLGVAHVIAHSGHWTGVHLAIVAGVILMLGGLLGVRHSLSRDGLTGALTRLGTVAATVGATIGLVLLILDGVAAKQLADQWAAAPDADKPIALGLVSANETVNFALGGLFTLSFAGVPFVLFGLAVARARTYPRWLGGVAFVAGIASIGGGTFQALTGVPTVTSLVLTIIGPTVITLWLVVMGVFLWRRSGPATGASAG